MLAKDVMTMPAITVPADMPVSEVAKKLLENRISAVPVVDAAGKMVGIVSEGDLMRRPESGTEPHPSWWLRIFETPEEQAAEYVKSHGLRAADVMTRDVQSVEEDTPVADIAELLETLRIKRVPVMRGGEVVGVVSRANLIQALATYQAAGAELPSDGDRAIRERILETLRDEIGARIGLIDVTVRGGVVNIWGIAESEEEKIAIRIAAESASGVASVSDHVGVLPPHMRALIWAD